MWVKEWKQVDCKCKEMENKKVSKRVCQTDLLSNQFMGLEYKVRNGKNLRKTRELRREIINN